MMVSQMDNFLSKISSKVFEGKNSSSNLDNFDLFSLSETYSSISLTLKENQSFWKLLDNELTFDEKYYSLRYSLVVSLIYFLAYTLIFILGIIGNSFVVAVVFRSPRMKTVTNYFIVNLALADILVLIFCLPATLIGNLFNPWILGLFMCKAVSYLQGVSVSASINTLVAVSIDRFLAICYPLKCQMSKKCARRVILIIWLFSLIIALPWAIYFTLIPVNGSAFEYKLCIEKWPDERSEIAYFIFANLCFCYLIPLSIIIACYIAIWFKVWKRKIPTELGIDSGKNLNIQMDYILQKSKLKLAKMMIVVVVIFAISWLPLYCVFARFKLGGPMENGGLEEKIFLNTAPIAQWLGASNSCINPVLYAFLNQKYKKGFAAIIKSRKCCGNVHYQDKNSTYCNNKQIRKSNKLNSGLETQCEYIPNSLSVL